MLNRRLSLKGYFFDLPSEFNEVVPECVPVKEPEMRVFSGFTVPTCIVRSNEASMW